MRPRLARRCNLRRFFPDAGSMSCASGRSRGSALFTLHTALKAAYEGESFGGSSNDTIATAVPMDVGAMTFLPGLIQVATVIGRLGEGQINVAAGKTVTVTAGTVSGTALSTLTDGSFLARGTPRQDGTVWWDWHPADD